MNVSAKSEYACLAVMELARAYDSGEPLQLRRIAAEHDIPHRFLVQILLQLKAAGIVESTRGATGGYRLALAPQRLTLGQLLNALEGAPRRLDGTAGPTATGKRPMSDVLCETWAEVARAEQKILEGITIAELLARARGRNATNMYYI